MVASTAVNRASTSLFHLRSLVLLSEPEMEAAVNRAMLRSLLPLALSSSVPNQPLPAGA